FDSGDASVVEEGTPEPQSPECRRSNLFRIRRRLRNPIAGTDVMQEQIGKQGHRLSIELRDGAWSGHQRGDVTGGASDRTEDALAVTDLLIDRSARDRRQQPQEGCRAAEKTQRDCAWNRIALHHLLVAVAERVLLRKQRARDADLVAERIRRKGSQRRVLCLPSEATNPPFAGRQIDDDGCASADAIIIPVEGIFEPAQGLVRNVLDQSTTEERNRR